MIHASMLRQRQGERGQSACLCPCPVPRRNLKSHYRFQVDQKRSHSYSSPTSVSQNPLQVLSSLLLVPLASRTRGFIFAAHVYYLDIVYYYPHRRLHGGAVECRDPECHRIWYHRHVGRNIEPRSCCFDASHHVPPTSQPRSFHGRGSWPRRRVGFIGMYKTHS